MQQNQRYSLLERVLFKIIQYLKIPLSFLLRKKDDLWIFYPIHNNNVSDNIKSLLDYILKHDADIKAYIVVSNINNFKIDREYQKYIISENTIKGTILLLMAKIIITDGGNPFAKGHFNIIQLWHGTGYKNIMALSHRFIGNAKTFKNIKFVISSSESDQVRKKASFLTSNVYITGSPRNDVFYKKDLVELKEGLKGKYGLQNFEKIICYAPTFRQEMQFKPFSNAFLDKLQDFANSNNLVFLIKKHPQDKQLSFEKEYNNIRDITNVVGDIQEILLISDVLITDYSSIPSDFILLNRPVIFYTFDYDEYIEKSRKFYFDLKETLPGPFVSSEEELLSYITNLFWFEQSDYQIKFKAYQDMLHFYKDGNSSKRVYEKIMELIINKKI